MSRKAHSLLGQVVQEGAVSLQGAVAQLKGACNAQPAADTTVETQMSLPEPPSFVFWNEGGTYVLYAASLDPANRRRFPALGSGLSVPGAVSSDQHGVAVAVEPVALLNGVVIRGQNSLTPGERRHEHQQ